MLSSIFFINVTFNSICLYNKSFHLHIQDLKYQTLNIHRKIFDLFIFFNNKFAIYLWSLVI